MKYDGGPAFPIRAIYCEDTHRDADGLTKLEWFAGKALAQLANSPAGWSFDPADVAHYAYEVADAMLAEGKKREASDE